MIFRMARNDSGAITVEFCILAPIFIALMIGVFEFGMVFYTYYASINSARYVVRQLATNSMPMNKAEAAVRANLPVWIRDKALIKVSQSNPKDYSFNDISVIITISGSDAAPIHMMSWAYKSITISPAVTMQQEPIL